MKTARELIHSKAQHIRLLTKVDRTQQIRSSPLTIAVSRSCTSPAFIDRFNQI